MKFILLFLLTPLVSFSQNEITVLINGIEISNISDCPFYAEFDDQKVNLLDSSLFKTLLRQDSFFIVGSIQEINFKSNNLRLMKKIEDSIIIKFDSIATFEDIGILMSHGETEVYQKVEIITLRDNCIFYLGQNSRLRICTNHPAYYLNGKAVFDEDPKLNKKRKKQFKKSQKKAKHKN